jgi:hypothetical protein
MRRIAVTVSCLLFAAPAAANPPGQWYVPASSVCTTSAGTAVCTLSPRPNVNTSDWTALVEFTATGPTNCRIDIGHAGGGPFYNFPAPLYIRGMKHSNCEPNIIGGLSVLYIYASAALPQTLICGGASPPPNFKVTYRNSVSDCPAAPLMADTVPRRK